MDDGIKWNDGEPKQQGWYDVLIDGQEEDRLQWWVCVMNPKKKHWKDLNGNYADLNHKIQWTGNASARYL